ncbi:MAG: hypothetical protein KAS86_03085, partial [Candidatus Omnitrophica bacterium]|nr:hypothetical protein [Candidatus Omnitrophota bacterium]
VLKLHTAGALYKSDGTLNGRGNTGHYWSSTQSDSVRGYLLRFNNSSRNVFGDGKTDAFSVRCLRDIVPYPTSQAYYVTTAAGSQIDSSLWDTIQSVTTDETTPAGTSLKYLASFDGRQSWKYWTGSAWADSSFGDFQTNGMSKTALEAINGSQWSSAGGFTEGTVDFAIDLNTTDPASTPELTGISFNYLRDTYDRIDTGIGSWGMGYSESQKEQLYWLYKNGKAGLDPADLFLTHDPETGDPLPQGGWKWSYTSDPLEGHEVGNAWQDGDTYYIKLGSGLIGEPLGGGVPEIPVGAMPFLGTILSVALKRFKRRLLK